MTSTRTPPAAHVAAPPTSDQLTVLRAQLEEQRQFRLDQLAELAAVDPRHTDEVTEVLAAGARSALVEILAALYRMDSGTYGACTDCGEVLALDRLEVLPQAGQCVPCRRRAARSTSH